MSPAKLKEITRATEDAILSLQAVYTTSENAQSVFDNIKRHPSLKKRQLAFLGVCRTSGLISTKTSQKEIKQFYQKIIAQPAHAICLWVLCLDMGLSEEETHCNGYIFDKKTLKVYFFDPGLQVYSGENSVADVFQTLQKVFPKIKLGGDYQLRLQCECDTHCQSWSLMFLCEYKRTGNLNFMTSWRTRSKRTETDNRKFVAEFMLDHMMATKLSESDYRYNLLEDWWNTMRIQYKLDVYWDNDNLQSLIPLARKGFGFQTFAKEIVFKYRKRATDKDLEISIGWPNEKYPAPIKTLFSNVTYAIKQNKKNKIVGVLKKKKRRRKKRGKR